MYLKSLEIYGFKSFAEKTRLDFNEGVTAVVGPNGSGKSNIADALRWVLGEQSAKSLRGVKMEDVIFSGAESRRSLGFAEVSVTFDNADRRIDFDYAELKITRKAFRSGESEYLINGAPSRLKDVRDIFADTGIGRDGYSLVGQGRVDEILSAKSEDRRYIFEEAAGIAKFKARKNEAAAKLERQKRNLSRVDDILNELSDRVAPLEEKAKKARLYIEKRDRLKSVKVCVFVNEALNLEREIEDALTAAESVEEQIAAEEKKREDVQDRRERLEKSLDETEKDIKLTMDALAETNAAVSRKEREMIVLAERLKSMDSDAARFENEVSSRNSAILSLSERKKLKETEIAGASLRKLSKETELAELEAEFAKLDVKMNDGQSQVDELNANVMQAMRRRSETSAGLRALRESLEQLKSRGEGAEEKFLRNDARMRGLAANSEMLKSSMRKLDEGFKEAALERRSLENERETMAKAAAETETLFSAAVKNGRYISARLKALTDLAENYDGYYKSVKAALTRKKSGRADFSGVIGAVGELVETSRENETAIETALGGAVQNIVVETEDDARKVIDFLKRENAGRATFLPLTALKGKSVGVKKDFILAQRGVVGVAKDLARFKPAHDVVFGHLLGNVIVCDTLENALALFKSLGYAYKIVTRDGELLSAGGAITGGNIAKGSNALFGRGREINELRRKEAELKGQEEKLRGETEKLSRSISGVDERLADIAKKAHNMEIERAATRENAARADERAEELKAAERALADERADLREKISNTEEAIKNAEKSLVTLVEEETALKAKAERFQNSVFGDRRERDERTAKITTLRVALSALSQNLIAENETVRRIESEIAEDIEEADALTGMIKENADKRAESQCARARIERELSGLSSERLLSQRRLDSLRDTKGQLRDDMRKGRELEEKAREIAFSLRGESARLELKKERLSEKRRAAYDDIWEEYSLTLNGAIALKNGAPDILSKLPLERLRREERSLRDEISAIGAVDVGAIEELEQLLARRGDMETQRGDILEARKRLDDIITKLNDLMTRQFLEKFELISQNFSKVFSEMFGGGMARVTLTDKRDALGSGIEIEARPPGKTLQNMSLLSGGERALTATALLFGILSLKPSPFCVLDEVEAALDDANVARYAKFIKNFRGVQFIIITHRKGAMEIADVIYGVTMEERGVSKLISMSFEEAV
ncbi:MAG: chromosome segregation protein SMC [Clostridiales bacterium]|jgi:chromosome segregation protein|nr:chromosome segregation protein SMC [Clostridiales bacterium]